MGALFTLRWSLRELRHRWLQVAAIALVIAIGTGTYAALGSTATWRRESNDASFEQVHMYDLRVKAADGVDAASGGMLAVLDRLPEPDIVEVAEERLVTSTQVDASTADEAILVPGRIIGMDLGADGPHVNGVDVRSGEGRTLTAADAGEPVVLLERNFATFYDLDPQRSLLVAGDREVRTAGLAMQPEFFFVMTEEGGFFAEANFAALFTSLETAQELAGRTGRVNDLVLRLRPGVDVDEAQQLVEAAFADPAVGLAATVMRAEDEPAYQLLYDDIEGDQQLWNIFSALILAGATFGAFNLASRMVEAQRREIGIGMALGWSRARLAVRPLLVGAQIALLGAVFGVLVGLLVMAAIRPVYETMLPLPVWYTDFQPGVFLQGAAIGFLLPFVATAWPVWRAVRVMPADAIATAHRSARSGLATLLRRLPWPTSAFRRMPLGNVLRTPRRTILTALGIGAAISTLVATFGMLDSFFVAMDRNEAEVLGDHPDRVTVTLDRLVLEDGPELAGVAAADSVGAVEPELRTAGTLAAAGAEELEVFLHVSDLGSDVWAPTLEQGRLAADRSGIVIARKAAEDLGVGVGDTVTLEHPARVDGGFQLVRTPIEVTGIHPSPFRFDAYVDRTQLADFGLPGVANVLSVLPAAGATPDDVERELFEMAGIASVQPVAVTATMVEDSLEDFTAVFRVLQGFVLFLAVLIAYNATSINADERARERATLFAFGLRVRRVVSLEIGEGMLIGVLGTAAGVGAGALVVRWIVTSVWESTMPEMGLDVALSASTITTAVVLGVVAVAIAPLLTVRRLRRMDIPGTLRVVE